MITFLILTLVIGLILYGVIESGNRKKGHRGRPKSHHKPSYTPLSSADIQSRWQLIMATSATGASGLKSSINEADKLLDHVLRQQGFNGNTMGERLKSATPRFSDRNAVWRAHKLRNALAHEIGFDLVPSQAKEALADFERGLKDLGALS